MFDREGLSPDYRIFCVFVEGPFDITAKLPNPHLHGPAGPACRTPCCSPPSGSWFHKRPRAPVCIRPGPRRPSGPTGCHDGSVEIKHQRTCVKLAHN